MLLLLICLKTQKHILMPPSRYPPTSQTDGKKVRCFQEMKASDIKWDSVGADYIVDATGTYPHTGGMEIGREGGEGVLSIAFLIRALGSSSNMYSPSLPPSLPTCQAST